MELGCRPDLEGSVELEMGAAGMAHMRSRVLALAVAVGAFTLVTGLGASAARVKVDSKGPTAVNATANVDLKSPTVTEGNTGTTPAEFTLQVTNPPCVDVPVH